MANVEDARKKFFEAKKAVEDCTKSIQELQAKTDQIQDRLPGLTRAVEDAEKAKTAALDCFAMTSNKQTESALKAARAGCEDAQKKLSETHELTEATTRALKKQEQEFVRLNNLCDLAKRQCWESIADEIRVSIHSEVFENVQKLFVVGSQTSQTRQWILDSLFPSPSTDEFQKIRNELVEKYRIE